MENWTWFIIGLLVLIVGGILLLAKQTREPIMRFINTTLVKGKKLSSKKSIATPILLVLTTLLYLGVAVQSLFVGAEWFGIVMLSLITLVALAFVMILIDGYRTNILFFSGIGTNNLVILGNLGGVAQRYFARVKDKDFNPATGKVVPNSTVQQDFYTSWFLNYLANKWDIYYKGLNTKLLKPDWCASVRIPHAQVYPWTTNECKVKGLAHNVQAALTFEIEDIGEFLYLNGSDVVVESVKPDYESALRTFFSERGNREGYDVRSILGISTEGKMDKAFRKGVWRPTVKSAKDCGRKLVNIAIADIVPASTKIRDIEERQALAEAIKKAAVTEAEGTAESNRLVNDVQIKYEKTLKQEGVDRMALAIEKQKGAGTLVVGQAGTTVAIPATK